MTSYQIITSSSSHFMYAILQCVHALVTELNG